MIMLGVVGCIAQESVPVSLLGRLPHSGRQPRRVLRRAPQLIVVPPIKWVSLPEHGHFRPASTSEAAIALPIHVVAADMAAFQSGGVDNTGGAQGQQSSNLGTLEDL